MLERRDDRALCRSSIENRSNEPNEVPDSFCFSPETSADRLSVSFSPVEAERRSCCFHGQTDGHSTGFDDDRRSSRDVWTEPEERNAFRCSRIRWKNRPSIGEI